MPARPPFTLSVPDRKPVEVVLIEREDGSIVARTADELKSADAAPGAPRG